MPSLAAARLLAVLLLAAAPVRAATIEYLYVEANEGGSSGGHVALAFGDEVFHFQQDAGALLRLRRDPRAVFRTRYALLENRPVHVVALAVPGPGAGAARDAFAHRLLVEAAEGERLAALEADAALFAALAAGDAAAAGWPVAAAGYFLPPRFASGGAASGRSAALAALRARVAERHGAGMLAARTAATRTALAALPLSVAVPAGWPAERLPVFPPTTATRVDELAAQLTALEILAAAPAPRADALQHTDLPLAPRERVALRAWMRAATAALAELPASARSGWGRALLIGMARLAAAEAALASDRLVALDAWPADAPAPPLPAGDHRAAFLAALAGHDERALAAARADCFGGALCTEAAFTRLESAINRRTERRRAAVGGSLRVGPEVLLPLRPARRTALPLAPLDGASAAARAAAARAVVADFRAALRARRGYDLLARNCVTELFAVAAAGAPAALPPSGRAPWAIIPFVSAAALDDSAAFAGRTTWPSWRQRALARRSGALARVAEATTLTASSYRPGAEDSTFLFFTDAAPALRPLLGAANLAYALGDGTLGLFTWPADGGRRLQGAARGALFSLPELAFVNIRKGTTGWLTVDETE